MTTRVPGWPWLDLEAIEVAWREIIAPRAATATTNGTVRSVESAKVDPTTCLCCQCGHVSETTNDCPLCGSVAMLNLSRVLDREEVL